MSYGMFEDAAYRDIPVGEQRHHAKLDKAYAQITGQFGPFLRNAASKEDYRSRVALLERDIDTALASHQLSGDDQNTVMAAVFADTQPEDNPAFMIPDGQQTTEDSGDRRADKDEDVKLEHISRRRRADTHEHYQGEQPGSGGLGEGGGATDPSGSQPQATQPPATPSLNTSPAPSTPAAQSPSSPAPSGQPGAMSPSDPTDGGSAPGGDGPKPDEPSLGPPSGKKNPGKVPGHGMPGTSPMGQGGQGNQPKNPGKMKQMLQKVPQIGQALHGVMSTPAHQLFDSPSDFLNNRSVHQKLWDAAQTAGIEPRNFLMEHADELTDMYEKAHSVAEMRGLASVKTADWFGGDDSYDPVQGLNQGDHVVAMIDTTDDYSGQPVQQGSEGRVSSIYGDQITVEFDGGPATVDVQALQRVAALKQAGWQWDNDAQSFKSRSTSDFACSCGNKVSGVGQHLCPCGKTWNISSFMAGSKTGRGAPSFACREVKTDPKLVLANRRLAGDEAPNTPYKITDDNNVVNADGDVKGSHDSEAEARQQQKALYKNVPGAAEKESSRWVTEEWNSRTSRWEIVSAEWPEDQLPPSRQSDVEDDVQAKVHNRNFEPQQPDGTSHTARTAAAVRSLDELRFRTAQSGVWPIINDKDVQKNWQALMGIVTDPSQVGALENPDYQALIQDLYEEIVRRGLHTPDPSQNSGMQDPTQMGVNPQMGIAPDQMGGQVGPQQVGDPSAGAGSPAPGQGAGGSSAGGPPGAGGGGGDPMAQALQQVQTPQQKKPSPGVMSAYREGFKLALDGFVPFDDEPSEVVGGWVLGLNHRIAESVTDAYGQSRDVPDPYANRQDTLGDISLPKEDGRPVNNDFLVPGNDVEDPTQGMRDDFASDTDRRDREGQSDDTSANHAEDFAPKTGPSYKNRRVDVN